MKDNIFSIGVLYQLPHATYSLMSDHATPNVSFVCMIITSGAQNIHWLMFTSILLKWIVSFHLVVK